MYEVLQREYNLEQEQTQMGYSNLDDGSGENRKIGEILEQRDNNLFQVANQVYASL